MADDLILYVGQELAFAAEGEEGEEGEAAEEDAPNPVIPEGKEVLWAAVFFLLLWVLMKFVLLPPINRAREARAAKLAADRDAADAAGLALGTTQRDYEAELAGARAEANSLIEAARAEADTRRTELQAVADAELAELRQQAQADITDARATALDSLRSDVGDLAVSAASAVVQKPLDRSSSQAVIDRAIERS